MHSGNRMAIIGALILGLALSAFMFYELVLYPEAGFPTEDFAVVVAGANTLRVGHLLKFAYAFGLALILVGLYSRVSSGAPAIAQLAALGASSAITLMLGSGMLGLRILQVAEEIFVTKPAEAITTILLRSVTVAMFEAGILASGFFALLFSLTLLRSRTIPSLIAYLGIVVGILFILDRVLFPPLNLASPVLAIIWSFGLALSLLKRNQAEAK